MNLSAIKAVVKKVRLSEIVLAVLLFAAVYANRPPTIYINRTHNKEGQVLYNICVKSHRWGTVTNCSFAQPNFDVVNSQMQQSLQQLDDMSIKSLWRLR